MTAKCHRAVFRGAWNARLKCRAKRISQTSFILCSVVLMAGWTSDPPSSSPDTAPSIAVTRSSDIPLTDRQTLIMNEATKLPRLPYVSKSVRTMAQRPC
jgi:hypothetical protein